MSKSNYTHIIAIIDRSGSMSAIRKDMEGGFDAFIKEQQGVEGEATLTLAQFDSDYEVVHSNVAIADVPHFSLVPRGSTALLDAMGRTFTTERERINDMDEDDQPEKVVCVVITDGFENASREYNRQRIFDMISDLEGEESPKWDFVFLGANQDAISEGGSMGVRAGASYTYDASDIGTQVAFRSLSNSMTSYRLCDDAADFEFKEEDRAEQDELLKKAIDKHGKAIPTYIRDLNTSNVTTDQE
jgi:hypothetical protein